MLSVMLRGEPCRSTTARHMSWPGPPLYQIQILVLGNVELLVGIGNTCSAFCTVRQTKSAYCIKCFEKFFISKRRFDVFVRISNTLTTLTLLSKCWKMLSVRRATVFLKFHISLADCFNLWMLVLLSNACKFSWPHESCTLVMHNITHVFTNGRLGLVIIFVTTLFL